MLRLTKLSTVASRSSRAVASAVTNTVRSQSTSSISTSTSATSSTSATATSESKSNTKKHGTLNTRNRRVDVKALSIEALKPVDTLLANDANSREILNEFTRILTANNRRQYQEYGSRASSILKKANKEAHSNVSGVLPPTLEEIISVLEKNKILHYTHVTFIMSQLIKEGEYLGALNQSINYRQYLASQNQEIENADVKSYTVISYLLYTKDSGKPSKEQLLQVLGSKALPNKTSINVSLDRLGLPQDVKTVVQDQVRSLYLADQNPNSIESIKSAMNAARLGNSRKVDNSFANAGSISQANGIKLTEDTLIAYMKMYNLLFRGDRSLQLWNELIESGIKPNVSAWNLLLEAVSLTGSQRLEKVELVLKEMKAAGVKKNDETDAALIRIYSKFGKSDLIEKFATEDVLQKSQDISFAYMEWLSQNSKTDQVSQKLLDIKKQGATLPIETFNKLLYNFAIKGNYKAAVLLMKDMTNFKVKPDVATYTIILDCTFKLHQKAGLKPDTDLIVDFLKDMKTQGIQANEFTLTSIMTFLSRDASFKPTAELLFQYLQNTKNATKVSYVSMISAQLKSGDVKKAEQYFEQYRQAGFELDETSWSLMFRGFQNNKDVAKTKEYLDKLLATGEFVKKFNKFSAFFVLSLAETSRDEELINKIFELIEAHKLKNISPKGVVVMKRLINNHVVPVSEHVQKLVQKN